MSHEKQFEIGGIAIACDLRECQEDNGLEVVILDRLHREASRSYKTGRFKPAVAGHNVRWPDGVRTFQPLYTLRKRPPPQDWVKLCNLTDIQREVSHV